MRGNLPCRSGVAKALGFGTAPLRTNYCDCATLAKATTEPDGLQQPTVSESAVWRNLMVYAQLGDCTRGPITLDLVLVLFLRCSSGLAPQTPEERMMVEEFGDEYA